MKSTGSPVKKQSTLRPSLAHDLPTHKACPPNDYHRACNLLSARLLYSRGRLDPAALQARINDTRVHARHTPLHKHVRHSGLGQGGGGNCPQGMCFRFQCDHCVTYQMCIGSDCLLPPPPHHLRKMVAILTSCSVYKGFATW